MNGNELFTLASIKRVNDGGLAVMLVVQLIKSWPYVRSVPTKLLSVIVGQLLVVSTTPLPHALSGWITVLVNGLLISSTAVGGWHLVKGAKTARGDSK
jgi:hypothetical protein